MGFFTKAESEVPAAIAEVKADAKVVFAQVDQLLRQPASLSPVLQQVRAQLSVWVNQHLHQATLLANQVLAQLEPYFPPPPPVPSSSPAASPAAGGSHGR